IALRAFPIKHRDVDEFLSLPQNLLQGTPMPVSAASAPTTPSSGNASTVEAAGGQAHPSALPERNALPAPPSPTGGRAVPEASELSLSKDSGTNRILAVGPPRLLDELGRLIQDLDVQHPQVLVEALIVTLSDSESRDLSIALQKIGTSDGALWRL